MGQHIIIIKALFTFLLIALTFCGHSVIATTCNGTIMTDQNRTDALEILNKFRSDLETSAIFGLDVKPYPTAETLYKLSWSCELEEIANGFVQGCQESSPANPPDGHAFSFTPFQYANVYPQELIIYIALGGWGEESFNVNATTIYSEKIANLANVLNASLTVGCSAQSCGGDIIATVACVYDNPFLKDGDVMYKVGKPCSVNENCTAYTPAVCNTTARLCQLDDTTTSAPITTSTLTIDSTTVSVQSTTRGNLHPNPEINQICTDNAYMNDRIRMKALDMHNYPNMVKLNYDCTLETTAYAYASTCSNTYSSPSSRLGIEENIHSVSGQAVAYRVDAMGEAIKFWWKQIRLETVSIGMAVTFKRQHLNSQIRFFTMMAWATTTKLGCGVAKCSGNFFVVCHYQPGGNVVDDIVYTRGSPCSRCPTGSYCSTPLCVIV